MNRYFYFVVCFFIFVAKSSFGQQTANLKIVELRSVTKKDKISFFSSTELTTALNDIRAVAYKKGYIGFSVDSIITLDSTKTDVYGSVGPRFKTIQLYFSDSSVLALRRIGINAKRSRNSEIGTTPEAVGTYLNSIITTYENQGYPFAKLKFDSLFVQDNELSAVLNVESGPLVRWKGVEIVSVKSNFSERFISAYFHIQKGALFNQEELDMFPSRIKQLTYLKETKPHELLFTNEGAVLYLYLESKPVSSFSGTVGLQQDPVKLTTQFTGDVRLKLLNTLKRGELFELNWRSIQAGSPQLKIALNFPFLFNTPFGIDGGFYLFKRDSTFLELKSSLGVNYFLSQGNQLKAFYQRYSSNLLSTSSANLSNYGSSVSNQYGLSLQHTQVDYLPNPRKGVLWSTTASVGNRTLIRDTVSTEHLIYNFGAKGEVYVPLGKRFVFKTSGNAETFYTTSIQQNELLRFGGNLLQRGFLEEELLATTRITATAEFRMLLDQNSNIFVFFDQSWYERNTSTYVNDSPFGFGTGISFGTNLGIFSISVALGKQFDNPVLLKDSKVHVGYIAYF